MDRPGESEREEYAGPEDDPWLPRGTTDLT
jgi:hypothetical protein